MANRVRVPSDAEPRRASRSPRPSRADPADSLLERDDIIEGLTELIRRLGHPDRIVTIQIVGGAAIALAHFHRRATVDVDARIEDREHVLHQARTIARERNWRDDWLNDAAAQFIPAGFGTKSANWTTIGQVGGIVIQVATSETLLAMKLHAAQRRGARELYDLQRLLAIAGIESVGEAEALYGEYYPGDEFNARAVNVLDGIFSQPRPRVETPPPPQFG